MFFVCVFYVMKFISIAVLVSSKQTDKDKLLQLSLYVLYFVCVCVYLFVRDLQQLVQGCLAYSGQLENSENNHWVYGYLLCFNVQRKYLFYGKTVLKCCRKMQPSFAELWIGIGGGTIYLFIYHLNIRYFSVEGV